MEENALVFQCVIMGHRCVILYVINQYNSFNNFPHLKAFFLSQKQHCQFHSIIVRCRLGGVFDTWSSLKKKKKKEKRRHWGGQIESYCASHAYWYSLVCQWARCLFTVKKENGANWEVFDDGVRCWGKEVGCLDHLPLVFICEVAGQPSVASWDWPYKSHMVCHSNARKLQKGPSYLWNLLARGENSKRQKITEKRKIEKKMTKENPL